MVMTADSTSMALPVARLILDVRAEGETSWFSWTSPIRLVLARWFYTAMLLRRVAFRDFCEPCLPRPAEKPPERNGERMSR
jgi:hypothetical protein